MYAETLGEGVTLLMAELATDDARGGGLNPLLYRRSTVYRSAVENELAARGLCVEELDDELRVCHATARTATH